MNRTIFLSLALAMCLISCFKNDKGTLLEVAPNTAAGFSYPYLLFIPDEAAPATATHLIVEPNNTGMVNDDLKKHYEKARRTATIDYYTGNYLAHQMGMPLLVPVFPRPESDWKIYTHSLDRDAIITNDEKIKRIDLQLIAMIDDARQKMREQGYQVAPDVLMTGFSASGTFANRFTLIHPERIKAAAGGGLNGLLILPLDSLQNQQLIYPVGTGDFETLFNQPFQDSAFKATPQNWYLGANDDNDAIPYDDGYDAPERQLIYELLGKKMQPDRWEKCIELYQKAGVKATIVTYDSIGHEHPPVVKTDLLDFFTKALKNNDQTIR